MNELMEDYSNSLFVFDAVGIRWEIETFEPLNDAIKKKVLDTIESVVQTFSGFCTDSPVAKMAGASEGSSFVLPDDCIRIFELYDRLYSLTGGAIDLPVGLRSEPSGHDKNYSFTPATDCRETDSDRNRQTLITDRPVVSNIGAVVKSYLVDIISDVLFKQQVIEFIITAGGDVRHSGLWPFPVGLEHPLKPEHIIGIVDLQNNAICASAFDSRTWGGVEQTPDVVTALPARYVIATWVIAKNALTAHGLATALFYTSEDKLQDQFQFSSVRMFSDNSIEKSKKFKGELFLE